MSTRIDPLDQLLDQAADEVRHAAKPGPTESLVVQTLSRLAAEQAIRPESPAGRHRSRSSRRWLVWALAASVLVCVGALSFFSGSSTPAFAQVIAAVQQSLGLKLRVVSQFGSQPPQRGRMELAGDKLRVEWFDGVLVAIGDLATGRSVFLDNARKVGEEHTLPQSQLAALVSPIDQLRRAKSADAESLGQERIDGKVMDVYRLPQQSLLGLAGGDMRIWVDPATNLPARIVVRNADPKSESEITLDRFDWHAQIDPSALAVELPLNFQQGRVTLEPQPPAPLQHAVAASGAVRLISGDRVPRAIVWGEDSKTLTAVLTEPESAPFGQGRPHELRQWTASDSALRWSVPCGGGASLTASDDGAVLATCEGREIQIRHGADGQISQTMVAKRELPALALSGDGKLLAAGIADWQVQKEGVTPAGGVEVWDVAAGALVRTLSDDAPVTYVAVSPDGRWIAGGSSGGTVKVWRAADGELVRMFAGQGRAAFSPDSTQIVVAVARSVDSAKHTAVEVYDLEGFTLRQSLSVPDAMSYVLAIAFSPDGRSLAAGSWQGKLYRWNFAAGADPVRTDAIAGGIHTIAYSPDGELLATGSEDGALQLWSTK